ncbi:TonB-dependent receptor plug domain-containing protein [Qipengyuania sp. XHP0207]|uniref:TonB-dependent receptor plug domain-containing protein n=1 Tax=Qipengyuania sp. XHP0207 TaxID=3038078 RepID=UPI00241C5982|nr:TonB-dependent receptor plug domain-containing protein [Qipengyuania sp. XHP0207]MDG5749132.1 TonB-dependent receptor plug domain-containing protein [Qipengyuania sp. XHP0207]
MRISATSTAALAAALAMTAAPALAANPDDASTPAGETDAPTEGAQVFEPAYFERYAPRNALDMVVQIPGFTIDSGDNQSRGLGQATANVLVNGQRFSSKSDSVRDQLSRIPSSDVVRIEIVEGATLDIPGLSGQVANIIVATTGASGQFRWTTGFRPYNTEAQLYGGEASLTGSSGKLDYTVSISNENNRFGSDGPIVITDGAGALIETQDTKFSGKFDNPTLATNFTYKPSDDTIAKLNLRYGEDFFARDEFEFATVVAGPDRDRRIVTREDGPEYEIGGDIEFPFGPGKLKLIGLERFERDNFSTTLVDTLSDGSPDQGSRFEQINGEGERIGRFEYNWNMWKADWQLSGEAAFNRLDRKSSIAVLDDDGIFVPIPFPAGNGGVTEDRYEGILSITKQLTPKLSLQASAGGEYSKIQQTGSAANSRSFQRPKGAISLAWKPASDFDMSIEIRRRVGQLSFGNFLASVNLDNDNENGGNNELVPDQSWNIDAELNKSFGPWGSAKLQVRQAWFEDFVDFFPLANGGEARGNIGDAKRLHIELSGQVKFDPIGWNGAQLNFAAVQRWMDITDPFTGENRAFSFDLNNRLEADFRHDIPNTSWAYGAGLFTFDPVEYSRRFEIGRYWEGPSFLDLFVEHKDILGMTGTLRVANVLGARDRGFRTVFDGSRPDGEVLFTEVQDRRIGPIVRFTLSGNF